MKLYKCRVGGDEVASDAYPGEYPDASESKDAEGFYYKIEQDEMRKNGDNELCTIEKFNGEEAGFKEEYAETAYALVSVYGLEEVGLKSMKSYIMKHKKYLAKLMKALPAGKSPEKACVKKFAKLLGKKAGDAVTKNDFFKNLQADMDNIVFYTTAVNKLLGDKDAAGEVIDGTQDNAPIVICKIHSDDWTEAKGTPASFYLFSPGLIGEAC